MDNQTQYPEMPQHIRFYQNRRLKKKKTPQGVDHVCPNAVVNLGLVDAVRRIYALAGRRPGVGDRRWLEW